MKNVQNCQVFMPMIVVKTKDSAIFDHFKTSLNCNGTFDDFDILSRDNNNFLLLLKEGYL